MIENAEISDFLTHSLNQDLWLAELPNGYFIDVGWFPENDLSGRFVIRVFREYWDNQCIEPIETTDIAVVIQSVRELAKQFSS